MPADVPARWDVSRSHTGVSRVELWSHGQLLTDDLPILGGSVSEKRVTGVRASVSLLVDPSPQVYQWMQLPALEVRPYSGLSWGTSEFLCPLGRFPLLPPKLDLPLPQGGLQVDSDDAWRFMVQYKLPWAWVSYEGSVVNAAIRLVQDIDLPDPIVTATSVMELPSVIWDKDKTAHDIMVSLMDAIGGEAFFNRDGRMVIQDRVNVPGAALTDGPTGTVGAVGTTQDWSEVYNEVWVSSSNNDVHFFPEFAMITDPTHPAYKDNGLGRKSFTYSSPFFMDKESAAAAAPALLARKSEAALGWSVTAVQDVSRMVGDVGLVSTDLGQVTAVVSEAKHDLVGPAMTLVLGAA